MRTKNQTKCQEIGYTSGNLLDYFHHQKYYKLGIDLPTQTNTSTTQQINFAWKLEQDYGATMFFIPDKQQKTILNFSLNPFIVRQ